MTSKPRRKDATGARVVSHTEAAPISAPDTSFVPSFQEQSMRRFASRLNELMLEAGMNQSQLAAQVFGTTKDTRGFTVSRGRDRISNYLRGRDVPRSQNLQKIAKVFKLSVQDLAPELMQSLDKSDPVMGMKVIAGQTDRAHLTVNMVVSLTVAAQVIALLSRHGKGND